MIYTLIVQGHHNNTPPMNSNHGGHVNIQEEETVENKVFQMPLLFFTDRIRAISTICLKLSN